MSLSGLLLVDKEDGVRSTACVDRVRGILGRKTKVGHAGTLDSTASGLLMLLVGQATRLASLFMGFPKVYEAEARLGTRTSTDDRSGEVLESRPFGDLDAERIRRLLPGYLGWRLQVPPQVSAVHVAGQRAHDLARRGVAADLRPRPVFLARLDLLGWNPEQGSLTLRVVCSKGTYIRSLVRDLGEALGCGAHVGALRRTALGPFEASRGISSSEAFGASPEELRHRLLPLDALVGVLPSFRPTPEDQEACRHGAPLRLKRLLPEASGVLGPANGVLVRHLSGLSLYRSDGAAPTLLACDVNLDLSEPLR